MTAQELTDWVAYEQVYGPILPHERLDRGFAMLGFLLAKLLGGRGREIKFRDFLPPWYETAPRADDRTRSGFEALLRMAQHADD